MSFEKLVNKKRVVFFFFLILVMVLKVNTLNLPYIGDELGVYIEPSVWVKENQFNPFYGNEKLGNHPPLFFEVLALAFSVLGVHMWVGHLIILASATITLHYTYLIGSYLYNPKIGFIAALLLLFSPLFFAQIGMVMLDVFLMMMATITVYYALQKKLVPYLIVGNLLVLTKELGIIIIGAITLYKFIFENKKKIKELIIYSSPTFTFLLWLFFIRWIYGWFFFPDYVALFHFKIFLKEILHRLDQVFITNYKLILTFSILFFTIKIKNRKLKDLIFEIIIFTLTYITCRYVANILFLIEKILKIDLIEIFQINLHDLYSVRYVLPILVLTIFLIPKFIQSKEALSKKLKRDTLLLLVCIFSIVFFFSFMSDVYHYRYLLIIYPFFFIIGSKAMVGIFKRNKVYILMTILMLVLFVTKWWAVVYLVCGTCEENLQYLSVIETHRDMAKFIESNYPDSIVLTDVLQAQELREPLGGYVKKGIQTIEVQKNDFLRTGINNYKIPPLDKFDLVYYSIGGEDSKELEEVVNLYNLTLIKKIEKNDKIALLYGKNKYTFPNEF